MHRSHFRKPAPGGVPCYRYSRECVSTRHLMRSLQAIGLGEGSPVHQGDVDEGYVRWEPPTFSGLDNSDGFNDLPAKTIAFNTMDDALEIAVCVFT